VAVFADHCVQEIHLWRKSLRPVRGGAGEEKKGGSDKVESKQASASSSSASSSGAGAGATAASSKEESKQQASVKSPAAAAVAPARKISDTDL
jgi:hypothetical protein